jgi:ACT domain-containing protein
VPRVISHSEIESVPSGGVFSVESDAVMTPLAEEIARKRQITIRRGVGPSTSQVRRVTRQVARRMGNSTPEVIEAVVSEVLGQMGDGQGTHAPAMSREHAGSHAQGGVPNPGSFDSCASCLEAERSRRRTRAVLTTTGRNQKGIVARVTSRIADLGGDILDISQTLVGDYFSMIIVIDTQGLELPFSGFKEAMEAEVRKMGLGCMVMHEDVLNSLHRV